MSLRGSQILHLPTVSNVWTTKPSFNLRKNLKRWHLNMDVTFPTLSRLLPPNKNSWNSLKHLAVFIFTWVLHCIQYSPLTPVSRSVAIATTWRLHPFRWLVVECENIHLFKLQICWLLKIIQALLQSRPCYQMEMLHLYCCIKVREMLATPANSASWSQLTQRSIF